MNELLPVRFFRGFRFLLDGLRTLIREPGLKKWAVLPFITMIVLFCLSIWAAVSWLPQFSRFIVTDVLSIDPTSEIIFIALILLFGILAVVLHFYLVYLLATLISAPFYSVLAEKALRRVGYQPTEGFALRALFRMFAASAAKVLFLGSIGSILFILALFVPGANLVAAFFLFFIIAYDTADYSLEALGYSFRERRLFVKRHLAEFCGMATFVGLTLFIPGLILLLMPAAVVGSASLVYRLHNQLASRAGGKS